MDGLEIEAVEEIERDGGHPHKVGGAGCGVTRGGGLEDRVDACAPVCGVVALPPGGALEVADDAVRVFAGGDARPPM